MTEPTHTPGVYIKEISKLPPSVAQVETAIPAFTGFTAKAKDKVADDLLFKPKRIKSIVEFEQYFGEAFTPFTLTVDGANNLNPIADPGLQYYLNYALRLYFANGGGPCYICSVGKYKASDTSGDILSELQNGLNKIKKEDEPTLLLIPDAPRMNEDDFYQIYKDALQQCAELGDRFTIVDVFNTGFQAFGDVEASFRSKIGSNYLKYGAAYYPWLTTNMNYAIDESLLDVDGGTLAADMKLRLSPTPQAPVVDETNSLFHQNNDLYHQIKKGISKIYVQLPPSAAIAGIYAQVDSTRGVWKAPANLSLKLVKKVNVAIDDEDQKDMNVHSSGKSVNAIRKFPGKGIMVWGARTLAGNDNEWKYISVRRFFNMVEESVKKATEPFVFEPNDANSWVKVRAMIENFLALQWRAGALAGAKPEDAFYVRVGLGQTMTAIDILEGRMNVEIGMAVVRPVEFIILKFSHKMQTS
jgi:phage tail sheath protein FI